MAGWQYGEWSSGWMDGWINVCMAMTLILKVVWLVGDCCIMMLEFVCGDRCRWWGWCEVIQEFITKIW